MGKKIRYITKLGAYFHGLFIPQCLPLVVPYACNLITLSYLTFSLRSMPPCFDIVIDYQQLGATVLVNVSRSIYHIVWPYNLLFSNGVYSIAIDVQG
jgi:hypothetical protein